MLQFRINAVTKEAEMELVLNLSLELQQRLDEAAGERGLPYITSH